MKKHSLINLSGFNIKPGEEGSFFKWYDEIHIPMLMEFKGMKSVSRGNITRDNDDYPTFLTVFEFDDKEAFDEYIKSQELEEAHGDALTRSKEKKDR